ncbi:hypothetical protein HK100_007383, partial [Physocladia obscura]
MSLEEQLWKASRADDALAIVRLVQRGARVDARDGSGETGLFKASACGASAAVGALLRLGADASAGDGDGWTALHNAAAFGHAAIVRQLLSTDADADTNDSLLANAPSRPARLTPLMCACAKNQPECARLLLARLPAAAALVPNARGDNARSIAAIHEHLALVALIPASPLDSAVVEAVLELQASSSPSLFFHATASAVSNKHISSLADVTLPSDSMHQSAKWFWLSDWHIDFDNILDADCGSQCDNEGWRYSKYPVYSNYYTESDNPWYSSPSEIPHSLLNLIPTNIVCRRRWIRVRKRNLPPLPLPPLPPQQQKQRLAEFDYVERASAALTRVCSNDDEDTDDSIECKNNGDNCHLLRFRDAIQILLDGIK